MYSDQILNTESINESLSNRQSAKMLYLQKENTQLIQENEDLKEALNLNKEALRIAYRSSIVGQGNKNKGTKPESTNLDDFTNKLIQESEKLIGMLSIMSKDRSKAQSIALLQQQIAEENSNFFQEQIAEKDEKIKDLRMLIQDKEFVIQEFEKAKGYYDYGSNVLIRIRDITTPNDQSIKLHNEIEHLKTIITKLSEENQNLNNIILQKEELYRVLKQEILKLRLVILNPVNYSKMKGFIIKNYAEKGDEDAFMCGAFYKEVELHTQEEQNRMQQKLQQQQMIQQQKEIQEKQHTPLRPTRFGQNASNSLSTLQNQSQRLSTQFSGNIQIDKLNEKNLKLEESIKKMSKLHKKEVENNNILVSKVEEILRECDTCFHNNELLISSNLQLQMQIQDLLSQLTYFKSNQKKFYFYLRKGRCRFNSAEINSQPTNNDATIKPNCNENYNNATNKASPKSISNINAENGNQDKEVNVSILEEEGIKNNQKAPPIQSEQFNPRMIRHDLSQKRKQATNNILSSLDNDELTKDQAKIYLLNLAKDLYVNTNIKSSGLTRQVLKQIEIGGYKTGIITLFRQEFIHNSLCQFLLSRSKRCFSDPLDYICKSNDEKYSLNNYTDLNEEVRKNKQRFLKKQQIQEEENKIKGQQNNQKEALFNVDMSMIAGVQSRIDKQKQIAKKFQKIQVDVSFMSNDGDIGELD